jgi:hypothetical protein
VALPAADDEMNVKLKLINSIMTELSKYVR